VLPQGVAGIRSPEGFPAQRLEVGRGAGAESVAPSLGEVAAVRQDDLPAVRPKVGTKTQTSPAESAEIRLDHFPFQVLRALDLHVHVFPQQSKNTHHREHRAHREKLSAKIKFPDAQNGILLFFSFKFFREAEAFYGDEYPCFAV
jgi:hypothetical protein